MKPHPSSRSSVSTSAARPEAWVPLAVITAAAIVALLSPAPARAEAEPANRPSIVMVVIDTLRADHLGAYGYGQDTSPTIDALAERGVLFERTYSTSSWTLPAVASLLSGTYPASHGAATWTSRVRDGVPWLPAQLRKAGYHTMAVTSNPFLTTDQGFDRGFDTFDDETVLASAQWSFPLLESKHKALVLASTSATATRRAMELLNDAPEDQPFFLLVHYMDPHADYVPPAPFDTRFDPDYEGAITGHVQSENTPTDIGSRDLEHIKALYDGEIAHVDRYVGRLLAHLSALGRRDQTAVVLTADHGEELLDHGGWSHGHTLYEEVVRVPLIVDWPGVKRAGERVATPVSLVDVMPTLLGLIEADAPGETHGRSLVGAIRGEQLEPTPLLMQTRLSGRLSAAVLGDRKIIARPGPSSSGREAEPVLSGAKRFDLTADPDEQAPFPTSEAEAEGDPPDAPDASSLSMAQVLSDLLSQSRPNSTVAEATEQSQDAGLEEQQLQQLRELGYVGGGSDTSTEEDR